MVDDVDKVLYDVANYPYGYHNLENKREYSWENTNRASDAKAAKREEMKNAPNESIELQPAENAPEVDKINISINDRGDDGGDDGGGDKYETDTTRLLNAIIGMSTGELIGGDFANTKTIKERISYNLQKKMLRASFLATSLVKSAFSSRVAMDAYQSQLDKKQTYETLNEQLSVAFTKLKSNDETTKKDGFRTIRNLSLGLQQLKQEELAVQNLGRVIEAVQYLETLNSKVIDLEKGVEGYMAALKVFYQKNKTRIEGKLNTQEREKLQKNIADLLSLFGVEGD